MLGQVSWGRLLPYCLSQLLGAYLASALVYLVYYGSSIWHLNFLHMEHLSCRGKRFIKPAAFKHLTLVFSLFLVIIVMFVLMAASYHHLCSCLRRYNAVQRWSVDRVRPK